MSKTKACTVEEVGEMVRLYHIEGKSLRETAREVGRDWTTVRSILRRYEIPLRGRGFTSIDYPETPADLIRLAERLYAVADGLVRRANANEQPNAMPNDEQRSRAS